MSRRTTAPHPVVLPWFAGDVVQTGGTRWIIRSITGDQVVLDASSAPAGITWRTTLDKLPTRMES